MGESAYLKTTCLKCGGSVEFPEESENSTVPCPHCGKELFLYRGVRAIGTPPVQPEVQRPSAQSVQDSSIKYKTFAEVPWFRREPGPITLILMLLFSPVLLALCIVALTGDVYRNAHDKSGNLVVWGIANKIAAILLLLVQLGFAVGYYVVNRPSNHQTNEVQPAQAETAQPAQQPAPQTGAAQSQQQAQPAPEPVAISAQPEAVQLDWNKQENDAFKNGNIAFAAQRILANPFLRNQAIIQDPQMVAKTPFNYYGQVVKFTGTVGIVQDFPPGNDFSQMLGTQNASDIVMQSNDGTIIEMFCMKASGYIRKGNTVNLYGYPVGVTEVPNTMGGTFTHLIVVGNDYDDLGAPQ